MPGAHLSSLASMRSFLRLACTVGVLGVGASHAPAQMREGVAELAPGVPAGYLKKEQRLASATLLPAPPTSGSAAAAFDAQMHARAATLRGTARWHLAIRDASLDPDKLTGVFAYPVGIAITRRDTPRLYQLLRRVAVDTGLSTEGTKHRYKAIRPFVAYGETNCTPDEDAELRADGSYPSGHTALGWGMALALATVDPESAQSVLARGRAFGESRMVCNVHWQSDIIAGRFMASATIALLHAEPEFREDIVVARDELAAARQRNAKPNEDCEGLAKALAIGLPGAQ